MPVVVKRVKALGEGLLTLRAEIALMSVGHLAVFMSLRVTTEATFHCSSKVIVDSLLYQTHIILTHYRVSSRSTVSLGKSKPRGIRQVKIRSLSGLQSQVARDGSARHMVRSSTTFLKPRRRRLLKSWKFTLIRKKISTRCSQRELRVV